MDKDNPTVADMEAAHPDLVTQIRTAARSEGAAAERERIAGIHAHAMPGMETLVAEMVADGKTTPDQAAGRILAAHKASLGAKAQGVADVEKHTGKVGAAPVATVIEPKPPQATTPEGWKAEWEASAALQAEFPTSADYVAIRKAEVANKVKVFDPTARRSA